MPHVTTRDAAGGVLEVRDVKNLGWLLRRLNDVDRVHVCSTASGGGVLRAILVEGVEFESDFASASVMVEWLLRRNLLRGVEVWTWCGTLIGRLGPNCRQALCRELFDQAFGPGASL